jgi:hypothetical protein
VFRDASTAGLLSSSFGRCATSLETFALLKCTQKSGVRFKFLQRLSTNIN